METEHREAILINQFNCAAGRFFFFIQMFRKIMEIPP